MMSESSKCHSKFLSLIFILKCLKQVLNKNPYLFQMPRTSMLFSLLWWFQWIFLRPGVPTKWSKFPAMRGNFLCQNLIFVLRPRGNTWKITNTQRWPKLIYFKNCASNWTLTKTFSMSSQNRWNNHGFLYSSDLGKT